MAHTLTCLLYHIVFSVKDRAPLITEEMASDLHAYLGGIIRELKGTPLAIDSTRDHVHMLISLPPSRSMSDTLRILKTNSSRWAHLRWPKKKQFAWQTGFGAFTVSPSMKASVESYVRAQEQHHRKRSFKEELLALLAKHDVPYDPKHLW